MHTSTRYVLYTIFTLVLPLVSVAVPAQTTMHAGKATAFAFTKNIGQVTDEKGQARNDIDFRLRTGQSMNVFIGDGQVHYQFWKANAANANNLKPADAKGYTGYRLDVSLAGANKNAKPVVADRVDFEEHYYKPDLGLDGAIAYSYKKITYTNIYPNIDWVLYVNGSSLKYDFVVRPGGNVKDIKLQYSGATAFSMTEEGLQVKTPLGNITEHAPYSYNAATRQMVASKFAWDGTTLSFDVAPHEGTLVIDPTLDWGTYFGSFELDKFRSICADKASNTYVAGNTLSSANIIIGGSPHQGTYAGGIQEGDGLIAKFDSSGICKWATYYGGNNDERMESIICDTVTSNIYIGGWTGSNAAGLASGGFQSSYGMGITDGLLIKMNSAGQRIWASFYGGTGRDEIYSLAMDETGNIYMGGLSSTAGGNLVGYQIASPTGYEPNNPGNEMAFLAKFTPSGGRLWGTYYPGREIRAITSYGSADVYAGGTIFGSVNIATPGVEQTTPGGGDDAFLIKIKNSGDAILWATYYGGSMNEQVLALKCDFSGNVYVGGQTNSSNNIASNPAQQGTFSGGAPNDGFLAKFNPSNGKKIWGTYWGGANEDDAVQSIDFDDKGNVVVGGYVGSTSNVATSSGYQTVYGGGTKDGFLAYFNSGGGRTWCSYYGGSGTDEILGIVYNAHAHTVYAAGGTLSPNNISTQGAFQPTLGGTTDGFLAAFTNDTILYINQPFTDTLFCSGDSLKLGFKAPTSYNANNTFYAELSNLLGDFSSPTIVGTLNSNTTGVIPCVIPLNTPTGKGYRVRIRASSPQYISRDNGVNIHIKLRPAKPTLTSNSPVCEGQDLSVVTTGVTTGSSPAWSGPSGFTTNTNGLVFNNAQPSVTGKYVLLLDLDGCTVKDSIDLIVYRMPGLKGVSTNAPLCSGDTLKILAQDAAIGDTFKWTGPAGFASDSPNIIIPGVPATASGKYHLTVSYHNCVLQDSLDVKVSAAPKIPTITSNSPLKEGDELKLNVENDTVQGISYSWTGPDSFRSNQQNPSIKPVGVKNTGTYTVVATANGCQSSAITIVVIRALNTESFTIYPNPNRGNFTIEGNVLNDQQIPIEVVNMLGQVVYRDVAITDKKIIKKSIRLEGALANGVYLLHMRINGEKKVFGITLDQ